MLDHHIQQSIVYTLAFSDGMRFSELKPDQLENKAFDYHLKKVVAAGFVIKDTDGLYRLTSEGKRVGKGAFQKQRNLIDQAYSILLLAVRRKDDGAWLLYRRQNHPLRGLTGFMQARPDPTRTAQQVAEQSYRETTGSDAAFHVHGHGYFSVFCDEQLESFIHFTLLVADDVSAELGSNTEEYYWETKPDFSASHMLPTMQTLSAMCDSPAGEFVEAVIHL